MTLRYHQRDLRKGRHSEPGRVYHVTLATAGRRPIFADLRPARVVIRAMRDSDARGFSDTLAFALMPDHLHWLFELGESASLSRVVGAVKSVSARRLGGGIWQPGFQDRAARQDDDLRALARYLIANPLRAGLVRSVTEYPFWDCVWV